VAKHDAGALTWAERGKRRADVRSRYDRVLRPCHGVVCRNGPAQAAPRGATAGPIRVEGQHGAAYVLIGGRDVGEGAQAREHLDEGVLDQVLGIGAARGQQDAVRDERRVSRVDDLDRQAPPCSHCASEASVVLLWLERVVPGKRWGYRVRSSKLEDSASHVAS